MILESRKGQDLAKHLAQPIVARLAPDEIEDFDVLAEDFFDDPRPKGDHTLGSGLGLLPDVVVILMFVAMTLERLLAGKGSRFPKALLDRLAGAMVHGQEADSAPQFSSGEISAAFKETDLTIRRFPQAVQSQIKKILRRLLTPVGVLYLGANAIDGQPLRVDREWRAIEGEIRASPLRHRISLPSPAFAVTPDDLHRTLLANHPQVLHFSGHGTKSSDLIVETAAGMQSRISADSLLHLVTIFKDELRLVVLNACYSDGQAKTIASVVEAVVGMADAISDDAAASFSRAFYRALAHGGNLERAFDLGRSQIELDGFPEEAGIPRLFALREEASDIVLVEAAETLGSP